MSDLQKNYNWDDVLDIIRNEFKDTDYNYYLDSISLVSITEFEITLSVPSSFIRDLIVREYLNGKFKIINGENICVKTGIKQILKQYYPNLLSFSIIIDKTKNKLINLNSENDENYENNIKSISNNNVYTLGTKLNKKYTFENFIVGESNKIAYNVAKSIALGNYDSMDVNPLFLYGNVGLGKTHLCQSIALKIKEKQPNKNIIYLTAEKFMFLFVQSLQNQDINEFKNRLRNIDMLIIDDIQFILGKDKTQKEFFYTFETLINDNKQIILACDRSPMNLIDLDNKLKSRINGGLIIDIKEPDFNLKKNILNAKLEQVSINIDNNLVDYIVTNINNSCRDIEGFVKKLKINKDIMNIDISKNEIDKILNDFISKKIVTIDIIQNKVIEYYQISLSDLKSSKRNKEFVIPRHIAMYLSKKIANKSFNDIARSFNNRNHATVMHAVKKIENDLNCNKELIYDVNEIKNSII